jgi:predicted dehydrogenase
MEKTRVAVIGTGYLGKFHAEKYAQMPEAELVGVVDIDPARAEAVAGRLETTAYQSHRDLLTRVDAVSVVVPTQSHFEVSRDFLQAGADVFIEKPMTSTVDEAQVLIRLAKKNGLILQVGHLERFNPAVRALRDIVHTPMFIESHRLSLYKPRGTDVSVVLDLMIHDIDLILNFVHTQLSAMHAAGVPVITDSVDIANARLIFANGCVANVTASRISLKNERKLRLFQKDAYVSVDFAQHSITVARQKGPPTPDGFPNLQTQRLTFDKGDALNAELRAFITAVRTRQAPQVTGEMGRDALQIAIQIMEQIESSNRRFLEF